MGKIFDKWTYKTIDIKKEESFTEQLGISKHAARALTSKNPSNVFESRAILNPSLEQLNSPFYIKNMRETVDKIINEKNTFKNILIVTDNDSEGIISSVILAKIFEMIKINHSFETRENQSYIELFNHIRQRCEREEFPLIITIGISFLCNDLSSLNPNVICIDNTAIEENKDFIHLDITDNEMFQGMSNSGIVFKLGEALAYSMSPFYNKKIAVYDLETTGLDYQKDEIIEVASMLVENGIPGETFHSLINPGKKISAKITSITGITDEDVMMSPDSPTVIKDFMDFLSKADFISGHNILNFDNKFLYKEIRRSNLQQLKQKSLDTLLLSRKHLKDQASFKLASILERFHYKEDSYHRAMNDVKACAFALNKLLLMEIPHMNIYYERVSYYAGLSIIFNEAPIIKENRLILNSALDTIIKNSNKSLKPFLGILSDYKNYPLFQTILKHVLPIFSYSSFNSPEELREHLLLKNHNKFLLDKPMEEAEALLNKYINSLTEKIKNTEKPNKIFLAQLPDIPFEILRILATYCHKIIRIPIILFSNYGKILKGVIFFGNNNIIRKSIITQAKQLDYLKTFQNRSDFTTSAESLEKFLSSLDEFLSKPDNQTENETKSEIKFDTRINSAEKNIISSFINFTKMGPFDGLSNKIIFLLEDVKANSIYSRNGLFSLKLHECKLSLFFKNKLDLKYFKNQRIDLIINFLGKNSSGTFCGYVEDIRKNPLF